MGQSRLKKSCGFSEAPAGILTVSLVTRNIELAQARITEEQQKLALEVMEKFFRPLAQVHWENLEVTKYWEEMATAGLSQNSDL